MGVIAGNIWTAKKRDWFVGTFSRRMRQTERATEEGTETLAILIHVRFMCTSSCLEYFVFYLYPIENIEA